jgi:SprT protein
MISGDDRRIIHSRVNELLDKARDEWKDARIVKPMLAFNKTGTAAGVCSYERGIIYINHKLWEANRDDMLVQTVGHEVAHHVSFSVHGKIGTGHGQLWAEMMEFFGLPANQYHRYSTKDAVRRRKKLFTWRCEKGHIIQVNGKLNIKALRLSQVGRPMRCTNCNSPVVRFPEGDK